MRIRKLWLQGLAVVLLGGWRLGTPPVDASVDACGKLLCILTYADCQSTAEFH